MKLHNIVDAIALHRYSSGAYTQAQIVRLLTEIQPSLGLSKSSYKQSVVRLLAFDFIEPVLDKRFAKPMQQGGGKFYRITLDGINELEEVLELFATLNLRQEEKRWKI